MAGLRAVDARPSPLVPLRTYARYLQIDGQSRTERGSWLALGFGTLGIYPVPSDLRYAICGLRDQPMAARGWQ